MTWVSRMKEWGAGDVTFLSSDGEVLIFVVVDEPQLLTGKFKGKEQDRIGCPVVTNEGYMLFVTGKRVARKLSKFESRFTDSAFMVTRHGVEGDINATYEVCLVDDKAKTMQLFEIANREFTPDMVKESVDAALEIMKG